MQTARMVQAVVLMMVAAIAAGCAAGKEYAGKIFPPGTQPVKDSQDLVLRFIELENSQSEKDGWVTTDIIMGRDTLRKTLALDKLAKTFPAIPVPLSRSAEISEEPPLGPESKTAPVFTESKSIPPADRPVARNMNPGEVRMKRIREKSNK